MKLQLNIIIFIVIISSTIYSQPELWEVYTISNQPYINVIIDKFEYDSLYLKTENRIIALHQDSIKYILKRNESHAGLGIILGALAGGLVANKIKSDSDGWFSDIGDFSSTIWGILIGGLVGGLIGTASGADTRYDIENMDYKTKHNLLLRLFNKH